MQGLKLPFAINLEYRYKLFRNGFRTFGCSFINTLMKFVSKISLFSFDYFHFLIFMLLLLTFFIIL
jgi:hypothetical protein